MCLVADKSAQPAWLAADLLAHAESDGRAQTILVTHLRGLVTKVQDQLARQIKNSEHPERAEQSLASAGTVIVTPNLETSMALAEVYAPEKLVLAVSSPESVAKTVLNAGEIFMGHYTPPAVGAYLAGPATYRGGGGRARFESALGIEDFLKRTHFVKFEPPKLRELGGETVRLAELADRSGHGNSVELRLQKIRRARREREQAREAEL
jgi:histidinol dehydrogenase